MPRHIKTSTAIKNRGGTVMYAGTQAAGSYGVTKVLGIETAGYHPRKFDNSPGPAHTSTEIGNGTSTRGVWKPYSAGTYNKRNSAGKYVMMKYCNELAGVSNTLLNYAAAVPSRYIHKSERLRTNNLTAYTWTRASGTNAHGDPKNLTVYSATVSNQNKLLYGPDTNGFDGLDAAARVSRALPGQLAYMITGKTPFYDTYDPRT